MDDKNNITSAALTARFNNLGPDHRRVIDRLIVKAENGQIKYGELRLDTDPRDFGAELVDELLDAVHYATMDNVRLRRERDGLRTLTFQQRNEIDRLRIELELARLRDAPAVDLRTDVSGVVAIDFSEVEG